MLLILLGSTYSGIFKNQLVIKDQEGTAQVINALFDDILIQSSQLESGVIQNNNAENHLSIYSSRFVCCRGIRTGCVVSVSKNFSIFGVCTSDCIADQYTFSHISCDNADIKELHISFSQEIESPLPSRVHYVDCNNDILMNCVNCTTRPVRASIAFSMFRIKGRLKIQYSLISKLASSQLYHLISDSSNSSGILQHFQFKDMSAPHPILFRFDRGFWEVDDVSVRGKSSEYQVYFDTDRLSDLVMSNWDMGMKVVFVNAIIDPVILNCNFSDPEPSFNNFPVSCRVQCNFIESAVFTASPKNNTFPLYLTIVFSVTGVILLIFLAFLVVFLVRTRRSHTQWKKVVQVSSDQINTISS